MSNNKVISVIGGNKCSDETGKIAQEIGKNIAKLGAILVCGGLGGVMEAAAKGAKENGGLTVGILPGERKTDANPYIDIAIPTGLGLARNTLVVKAADLIVALPGEYGTLSEISFALIFKKPVINLSNWDISGTIKVNTIEEAVNLIKKELKNK
ncbi:MAG: TIGR00725 family protein [Candidatus Omnitrophica bacterium]|nr:TIGR00725 family protein [Candidatus Omnitrophota bacterium]